MILGIDCGRTGAVAALRDDGNYLDLEDLPIVFHGAAAWVDGPILLQLVRKWRGTDKVTAFVEFTHAMPDMGSVANNSKGMTLGSTLSTLQIVGVKIKPVEAVVWKRALGLLMPKASDDEKKAASLSRARKLFPRAPLELGKHHNRAEALLIAKYGQQTMAQLALEVA